MDHEVGYGKPPRHARFKMGEPSANARGRKTVMSRSSNSRNLIPETTMIHSCVSTDSLHARDL
jgi:hypothetical protein